MTLESERQAITDEEDLRLIPVVYWVAGAFTALFSLYPLIYVAVGVAFLFDTSSASSPPPAFIAWIFIGGGLFATALILALSALKILTGFWIRGRKHRIACIVVAGLTCPQLPYGTLLGVFTIMVLTRPTVASLFGAPAASPLPESPRITPPPARPSEDGPG